MADQNIYIDSNADPGGDGSYGSPYDAAADINWTTGGANSIYDWIAAAHDPYINIKGGSEFREKLSVGCSGVSGHPVTIQAYGSGNKPYINGSEIMTGFTGPDGNGEYTKSGVTTEPKICVSDDTWLDEGTFGSLANDEWDWDNDTLYLGFNPSGCVIEAGQREDSFWIGSKSYIEVADIKIGKTNLNGLNCWPSIASMTEINLYRVDSEFCEKNGIAVRGGPSYGAYNITACSVKNSTVSYCGQNGVTISYNISDIDVEDCIIDYAGLKEGAHGITVGGSELPFTSGWTQHSGNIYKHDLGSDDAYQVVSKTDKVRLTHNDGNYGTLALNEWDQEGTDVYINVGGDPNGDDIRAASCEPDDIRITHAIVTNTQDNSVGGIEGHGIALDGFAKNCVVSRCISKYNAGAGITHHMGQGNAVHTNIAYNNEGNGVTFQTGGYNGEIYNNTLFNNENGVILGAGCDTVSIKNNISMNNTLLGIYASADALNITHDHNCSYGNGTNWAGALSKGGTDIEADPKLADPANNDYRPRATSPCINAGVDVGLTEDYDGNSYDGLPDIGAYEYQYGAIGAEMVIPTFAVWKRHWSKMEIMNYGD